MTFSIQVNDGKGADCQRTTLLRMRPLSNSEPETGIPETGHKETPGRYFALVNIAFKAWNHVLL